MVANKFIKEPQNLKTLSEICKHKRGYEHQDMTPFERASIYVVEELKLIANYRFLAKKKIQSNHLKNMCMKKKAKKIT